jgi:cold-inducible RNA-binding protein
MNLYVGNLPYQTNEDELRQAFSAYGEVTSASIIKDRDSGASRGFAFVEMPNDNEARLAIQAMNGVDIDGRALHVNELRPRKRRGRGGEGDDFGGGGGARWEDRYESRRTGRNQLPGNSTTDAPPPEKGK